MNDFFYLKLVLVTASISCLSKAYDTTDNESTNNDRIRH